MMPSQGKQSDGKIRENSMYDRARAVPNPKEKLNLRNLTSIRAIKLLKDLSV